MRKFPYRLAVLALIATSTLVGCGGSSDEAAPSKNKTTDTKTTAPAEATAPSFDADPADGKTITGKDYSYSVPDGWDKPKQDVPGFKPDTLAVDLGDTDGFADNINVVRQEGAPKFDDKARNQLIDQLSQVPSFKNPTAKGEAVIDGEPAFHVSSGQLNSGVKSLAEQYYVVHDSTLNVVTFSFSPDVPESDRDEVAGSVLTTWKWAS